MPALIVFTLNGVDYVSVCCVCKKTYLVDGTWGYAVPNSKTTEATHTYCPKCAEMELAKIRR